MGEWVLTNLELCAGNWGYIMYWQKNHRIIVFRSKGGSHLQVNLVSGLCLCICVQAYFAHYKLVFNIYYIIACENLRTDSTGSRQ